MALYQPSFMVPKNQAIDATDENDMTFSFKLNGNNPLVAYNIQIFDNDTNQLVYELVSTKNERAIQKQIKEVSGWIANQENKQNKVNTSEEAFKSSEMKTAFRTKLKSVIDADKKKIISMGDILQKKKEGKTLGQTEITKYFEYWENILNDLKTYIGNEEHPLANTGEYILNTIEDWLNIDPARTDGVEYEDEEYSVIDRTAFNKIKDLYESGNRYFKDVQNARIQTGASDTTYINDTTLNKAKQAAYLIYSEFSDEMFYNRDLYESVNKVWNSVDFEELRDKIEEYTNKWRKEVSQLEYALAHLSGGQTTQKTNVYKSASASQGNVAYILNPNDAVAVITDGVTPPSGWYYISSNGEFGYIESKYVKMYNIEKGKYYLETPIYPTNYEGEQNTVCHQLPVNVLENGKAYKWSATLYWSTSGRYDEDNKIDGILTSVENYFDTRKKPIVGLDNLKQIFMIPFNFVTLTTNISLPTPDGSMIAIKAGSSVRIITLLENDETQANIEYIDEKTNVTYQGVVPVSYLSSLGLYNNPTNYILPSKKVTFKGHYEQEQFVSISYFRWVLYKLQNDSEKITEVVKDTGMVPSVDFQFFYDGFLNDEKYAIKIFVQTLDNVEAETELIKFKVSYISYEIDNMLNAENSPIEHGIVVEWSNLRLIQGTVEGTSHYEDNIPSGAKTALTLDKGSELIFDKDKGKPLALDWEVNQILCTRFDEDRPLEPQKYYTASGLDDNGEVISKTLEMIPLPTTQDDGRVILRYTIREANNVESYDQVIIASPLYWYIIIMKKDGFVVYTKYAQGLFPAIDQYPNLNKFTGGYGLYPDALTYLEEPSGKVVYDYQKIVDRNGNEIK